MHVTHTFVYHSILGFKLELEQDGRNFGDQFKCYLKKAVGQYCQDTAEALKIPLVQQERQCEGNVGNR